MKARMFRGLRCLWGSAGGDGGDEGGLVGCGGLWVGDGEREGRGEEGGKIGAERGWFGERVLQWVDARMLEAVGCCRFMGRGVWEMMVSWWDLMLWQYGN